MSVNGETDQYIRSLVLPGYTELMFRSWKSNILANINDRELDNKSAIQLIKEQTLDNARREVKFQLDLCGGDIS